MTGAQTPEVRVLDVAPVLPEVRGDAVGPGFLGQAGGGDGVRLIGASGLPDRGDVVDVDIKTHGGALLQSWTSH